MSLSILMVGNSLTAANAMPTILASLLGAQVVAITRGGRSTRRILQPSHQNGIARSASAGRRWNSGRARML